MLPFEMSVRPNHCISLISPAVRRGLWEGLPLRRLGLRSGTTEISGIHERIRIIFEDTNGHGFHLLNSLVANNIEPFRSSFSGVDVGRILEPYVHWAPVCWSILRGDLQTRNRALYQIQLVIRSLEVGGTKKLRPVARFSHTSGSCIFSWPQGTTKLVDARNPHRSHSAA